MRKLSIVKISMLIFIIFFITNFAQGMWITCFGYTNKLNENKFIIEKNIKENNKCIEINVSYPQLVPNSLKLIMK